MKSKKVLCILGVTTLILAGGYNSYKMNVVSADEPELITGLNALVNSYYNEGTYLKETVINLNEEAVADLNEHGGFHADADDLIRVTKFTPTQLTMTIPGNDTYESNYGTDEETGGLTHWGKGGTPKVVIAKPESAETAGLWRNWEEAGMEGYYWTVNDIVATDSQNWALTDGVYSSSDEEVVEWFKAIVAPCYIGFNDGTSNYITLESVEIQEVDNTLQLRLFASSGDLSKLTNENCLFAQATISQEHTYHVCKMTSDAEGHYESCLFCNYQTEEEAHSCAGKEEWEQGRVCDVCGYGMAAEHALLAEFTFENGFTNTGVDSSVYGTLLSNADANRYEEVTDSSYLISGKFSDTTVLKVDHNNTGKSFGIKGIDTGTGDFAISIKYALASNVSNIYSKANQFLIMGTNTETNTGQGPAAPCFAFRLGKDSSGAGYVRTSVKVNDTIKNLYVSNTSGYFQSNTLVEFRIIKKGTTVTVHIECPEVSGQTKCCPYTVTYELESPEDLMITPDQVLGFGCNYGVARPGNSSYVDDIKVWNYAYDFGE